MENCTLSAVESLGFPGVCVFALQLHGNLLEDYKGVLELRRVVEIQSVY